MEREKDTERESEMGWPRLVGSLQLQVSFAEYSLFYRALLQKRPIFLRSRLIVAYRERDSASKKERGCEDLRERGSAGVGEEEREGKRK